MCTFFNINFISIKNIKIPYFRAMETVVSGIRSTGNLHLGNYYGAIQNFVKMQHEYNCFFFIKGYPVEGKHAVILFEAAIAICFYKTRLKDKILSLDGCDY